jgi:hypothetical protein
MQIAPGKMDSYALEQNPKFKAGVQPVVHVLVEPASATWETAPSYWVECLTPLPVTVVAKGARDSLQFTAENGMVSQIPQGLATGGAFVRMMAEPVQPKKEEPPPPKEAAAAPEGTGPEAPK